jgi:hypothetical protein
MHGHLKRKVLVTYPNKNSGGEFSIVGFSNMVHSRCPWKVLERAAMMAVQAETVVQLTPDAAREIASIGKDCA